LRTATEQPLINHVLIVSIFTHKDMVKGKMFLSTQWRHIEKAGISLH